jgi:hypothetical protein
MTQSPHPQKAIPSTVGVDTDLLDAKAIRVRSPTMLLLLAIAFLYPILLCAFVFPTPFGDLREQINWGLQFPLYTYAHPPLQSWIAGLVALSGARDAWAYVLVAQLLNLLGFFYVAETARILFGASGATASWVALAGGLYFIGHVPTDALNADQLLFPLWSGVVYHLLQALRQGRWRDWTALGVVAGLSFLAKYFSGGLIIACAVGLIWIPKFRRVFHDPRFYLAAVICALLFLPTAVAVLLHQNTLTYSFEHFFLKPFDFGWLESIALFLVSPILFGFPFALGLLVTVQRKTTNLGLQLDDERRLVLTTALAISAFVLLLIVIGGLEFFPRYLTPLYGLGIIGVLCGVHLEPAAIQFCARLALYGWALCLAGTGVYISCFVNARLREPAPAAAAVLQHNWDSRFSCGPGYILGDGTSAFAIALYYTGRVTGVSVGDYLFAQWVDRDRLRRLGAIVITTPSRGAVFNFFSELPNQTPRATLAVPYRRTLSSAQHVYIYSFIAPQDCLAASKGNAS